MPQAESRRIRGPAAPVAQESHTVACQRTPVGIVTYEDLAAVHLGTVAPAFFIGTYLLARRKGTRAHKQLGRVYLLLMTATGAVTLFMPAQLGPTLFGHFGFIHAFSLLALYSAPTAYLDARRGNVKSHRSKMIGLYVGGILIAGAFAFAPGRMLNDKLVAPVMQSITSQRLDSPSQLTPQSP